MGNYIIADNQELTRFALESLLSRSEDNRIWRAATKAELLARLREHENSVVIMDYTLMDFDDEQSLLVVSERYSLAHWVLVSDELTERFLRHVAYASHAFSVVFKDSPLKSFADALRAAQRGERYFCQRATELLLRQTVEAEPQASLTQTEREVLRAIAQGKTTKDIAAERISSVHTINTHRKNIFRKLGVNTAHEAVRYAVRAGSVDLSEFYI